MEPEVRNPYEAAAGTLLIVDDSEINRAILAEIFRGMYRLEEAENGQEALEKIQSLGGEICAILLDVIMPVIHRSAFRVIPL